MAYNITLSNGQPLVTVPDGQVDESASSLTLIGKNYPGYGKFLNENFVQILENFANSTEPRAAVEGQLWWDTTNKRLSIRSNSGWKTVSGSTPTQPTNPMAGDIWWDPVNLQLKAYAGTEWKIVGPMNSANTGQTGMVADSILESGGGQSHIIIKFTVFNTVVAILSKDPSFTITTIPGFSIINPGFNLSADNSLGYYGLTDNAAKLGGILAANYLRTDVPGTLTGALAITANGGLTVGASSNFTVSASNTDAKLISNITGRDLGLYATVGGTATKLIWLDGTTGKASAQATTVSDAATTIVTKGYLESVTSGATSAALMRDGTNAITGTILPQTTDSTNLGSTAAKFANIYATNFTGLAYDSSRLANVAASSYARLDNAANAVFSVAPSITTNTGISIGASSDFKINVNSNAVNLVSDISGKSMYLSVKVGGVPTNVISIDGTTGKATTVTPGASDGATTIATKGYVDGIASSAVNLTAIGGHIIPAVGFNNVYNIGSPTLKFNTVYATTFNGQASTALYADLAERFAADAVYAPGTVLTIGGTAEVTMEMRNHSDAVFGVVSTNPAYLMNAEAGSNDTHPAVVLAGKAPVRVIGAVKKGDRLVSAGNGVAKAADTLEATPFNVIGRALETNDNVLEKLVNAIVKINT
jgi:hypothetical protein